MSTQYQHIVQSSS